MLEWAHMSWLLHPSSSRLAIRFAHWHGRLKDPPQLSNQHLPLSQPVTMCLTGCVTLDKVLTFPEGQSPHFKMGKSIMPIYEGCCEHQMNLSMKRPRPVAGTGCVLVSCQADNHLHHHHHHQWQQKRYDCCNLSTYCTSRVMPSNEDTLWNTHNNSFYRFHFTHKDTGIQEG